MNLTNFAFAGYAEHLDLLKPIQVLIEKIKFETPLIFSISTEEENLQDMISEMIHHEIIIA